jgi:predicted amidohydrolase
MTGISTVRVAAAQYSLDAVESLEVLRRKLERWVAEAAANGARLLVFPEFSGMELVSVGQRRRAPDRRSPSRHMLGPLPSSPRSRRNAQSLEWETEAVQKSLPQFLAMHSELAAEYGVYILAGSLPVILRDGTLRNRAHFFAPDGSMGFQDKLVPTRWESEVWQVCGGDEIRVFETDFGPIGIAICYDVEFPLIARLQAEAGARIVLAPCCCDSERGFHRVRVGAQARALENQAYVVEAVMIGNAQWSGVIGQAIGLASVYSPPDLGPNVNGVIAQATGESPQWLFADLDLAAVERIRRSTSIIANADQWNSHLRFSKATAAPFTSLAAPDATCSPAE